MPEQEIFDALIIGGGPGGISCAAELKDSGLTSLILEKAGQLGGQLTDIPTPLRNFAGGNYDNGDALRKELVKLADTLKLNYRLNCPVTEVDFSNKTVVAEGQKFVAKTIVLATGYRVAKLGVSDETSFGLDVVYRTGHCLEHLKGNAVAVVGGGDSAVENALELAEVCPQVYLIYRSEKLRARPDWLVRAQENPRINVLLNTKVVSLMAEEGKDQVRKLLAIKIANGQGNESEIAVSRLVIKIGYSANTELCKDKLDMDDCGHVLVGKYCSTSKPGVFAIGDITTPGYARIATAVGQGVLAVAGIRTYLGQSL